jgi:PPOX class probable F420-dependent enzyme
MDTLADSKVRNFLSQGTKTAKLAFVASDGRPVVTPVWFVVDGDEVIFNTAQGTAKGKALARDSRVSLCVDVDEMPYSSIQIQGTASTSTDHDEVLKTATQIASRYLSPDQSQGFGAQVGNVPGEMVVRVRPTKVIPQFNPMGS